MLATVRKVASSLLRRLTGGLLLGENLDEYGGDGSDEGFGRDDGGFDALLRRVCKLQGDIWFVDLIVAITFSTTAAIQCMCMPM